MELQELFDKLSQEAKIQPKLDCLTRAKDLYDAMFPLHGEKVRIILLTHINWRSKDSKGWGEDMFTCSDEILIPRNYDARWNCHYSIQCDDEIWDPAIGRVVHINDYLSTLLKNPSEAVIHFD